MYKIVVKDGHKLDQLVSETNLFAIGRSLHHNKTWSITGIGPIPVIDLGLN